MESLVNLARMDSKKFDSSRHKRSKSDDLEKRVEEKMLDSSSKSFQHPKLGIGRAKGHDDALKKPSHETMARSSLKQEVLQCSILQLEKRLKDQLAMRHALEKALGYRSSIVDSSNDSSMPKPTKELIREIAVLELEVMYMEQYLLSLYRKAFDQQISPNAAKGKSGQLLSSQPQLFQDVSSLDISSQSKYSLAKSSRMTRPRKQGSKLFDAASHEELMGPAVHRCQSALSHRAVYSSTISPSEESLARALQTCHSQPLSFLEDVQSTHSGVTSLAEYLGTNIADHIPETPNRLSEDMVRCMAAIYCKLSNPPLVEHCLPSSPTSSFSSMSAFSPQYLGDMWSPGGKRDSTLNSQLINPFRVEGLKEFSGPYNAMVEVPSIYRDSQRLSEVDGLLQNYKLLVYRLETIDPRKMKNDEKLAFWINIHNALMMHAYLLHGVPQNNTKKASLLIKATCVVGGRSVNADTIQGHILACRTHCPGQWFRTLLSPKIKLRIGGEWRAYAIERPEPLLHFALCSGSHSDPAVRVYTYKRLFQQLEAAKEEYIRATVGIRNEQKILLPKVLDSYAKDMSLSSQQMVDMIKHYLPESLRMAMQRCQQGRSHKITEWVPHNFAFRYLLSREVANPQIN